MNPGIETTTVLKTAPTVEPVSLSEAKEHCHLENDFMDQDDYILTLIKASRRWAGAYTFRKFITQTWTLYANAWPMCDYFELPFGNLQSVSSVKYTDSDGDESTWSSSNYIVDTSSPFGRVTLGYSKTWPSVTLYPSNPIAIEFVCGYGDAGSDVDDDIVHAIKLRIGDMYEIRESAMLGQGFVFLNTNSAQNLLRPHRLYSWG